MATERDKKRAFHCTNQKNSNPLDLITTKTNLCIFLTPFSYDKLIMGPQKNIRHYFETELNPKKKKKMNLYLLRKVYSPS